MVSSMPRPHLPTGKTRNPLYRRLGGPQGGSGRAENLASHRDSIPDRPARSQSPYRLSYPAPQNMLYCTLKFTYVFWPLLPTSTGCFTRILLKYNSCPNLGSWLAFVSVAPVMLSSGRMINACRIGQDVQGMGCSMI